MECAKIKSLEEIKDYLLTHHKTLRDYDDHLSKGYGTIYKLSTGEVILTPTLSRSGSKCLLFTNEECFLECLRNESFPIENEDKEIFEYDLEGQRNIHKNISKYHGYLNKRLKLNYLSLDRSNIREYYEGVLKLKKKTQEDILALGAVMGELWRKELNGKWILEKWYGTYNPYYKPLIVYSDNKLQSPYDKLIGMLKWKEKDANKLFFVLPLNGQTLNILKEAGKEVIELQ